MGARALGSEAMAIGAKADVAQELAQSMLRTPILAEDATSRLREAGALLREGKPAEALKQLDRLRSGAALSALDSFQLGWLYGQARSYLWGRASPWLCRRPFFSYLRAASLQRLARIASSETRLDHARKRRLR